MLEIIYVIDSVPRYGCSSCGSFLFLEGDNSCGQDYWVFCPFCGQPLHPYSEYTK